MSSGHICTFESMQVRSALLDEVMKDPENTIEDLILDLDIKVHADSASQHCYTLVFHFVCVLSILGHCILCVCCSL